MKNLLIVFIIIGLCGAGAYWYLQKGSSGTAFEQYLPADAVGYFQVNDFDDNMKRLFDTQTYQSLAYIDFGPSVPGSNPLKTALDVFEKDPNASGIRMLLKHKFAIVMYDVDIDFSQPVDPQAFLMTQMEGVLSGIVVAAEMDAGTQVAEKLMSGFKDLGQDVSISDALYAQKKYHVVTSPYTSSKMYYATFDNVLIATLNEDALQRSIDAAQGQRPVLAGDAIFKNHLPDQKQDMFGYYDIGFLMGFMQKMSDQLDNPAVKQQMLKQTASMEGFNVITYAYQWDENLTGTVDVKYDTAQLNAKWQGYYTSCIGTKNKTLAYVPENILLYHWAGCVDWQRIAEEYVGALGQNTEQDSTAAAGFLKMAERYIAVLGSDVGGYLVGIDQGMFPVPRMMLMIGLKDTAAVRTMLEPFMENPMVRVEKVSHAGQEILKVTPPINVVMPGVAFTDEHLIITTHIDLLTEAIDRANGTGTGLKDSPDFKKLGLGSPDDGSFAQYIALSDLITEILKFEDYGKGMIEQQATKQQAFQQGSLRRLEDIRRGIKEKQEEIKAIKSKVVTLEDEVFVNEVKGMDVSVQKTKIEKLKQTQETLRQKIAVSKEQEADTQSVLSDFQNTAAESEEMTDQVDNTLIPVLESLKNVNTFGVKNAVFDDKITTNFFVDVR